VAQRSRQRGAPRALAAGLCAAAALALAPPAARAQGEPAAPELLVRLRGPIDDAALRRLEARSGGRVLRVLPAARLVRLALPAGVRSGAAVAGALGADPAVESVRPNGRGRGGFAPDDPLYGLQWHLRNTGVTGGTPGVDIDAPGAWAITRGSEEVVVAILDTGVDFDHPDLAGRLLPGFDFVNGDADASADHPHGVQVTGLFGANADNGVQVAGVDHAARILPVKVLDDQNEGWTSDLIEGLYFAAGQGADVIGMSLVGYPPDDVLQEALGHARASGAVLVACAGNSGAGGADVSFPGAYPETISVGWTDATDSLGVAGGDSSATGAALDLVAPGASVLTIGSASGQTFFSGCSAATPIVAGIASLLRSVDPTLTHDEVAAILAASAEDQVGPPIQDVPGRDDFYGAGRVNAAAALALVPEPAGGAPVAAAALAGLARGRRTRGGCAQSSTRSGSGPTPKASRTRCSQRRTGCWSRASRSFV
jgi:subtilisin family serine protease